VPICSECQNAAFASSGVYCMALGEHIFDEAVAEECGLYEGAVPMVRVVGGPGEADIISLRISNGSRCVVRRGPTDHEDDEEFERTVTATVEIGYFGRAHNGGQVLETLRRICQQEFGSVEVH
jgi:hypothetical protein